MIYNLETGNFKEGFFMDNLFRYDNKFFEVLGKITDIVILNLLFIVSCIPVVTIGAALSASYYVGMKIVNNEDTYIIGEYIKRFKENFKVSTIVWILMMIVGSVLIIDFYFANIISSEIISNVFRFTFTLIGIIFMFTFTYVFPIISKFENTIKNTIKNSILISIQNLPFTIIMVLVNLSPLITMFLFENSWGYTIFFYTVIGFGISMYINSIFLSKILNRYVK